MILFNRFTLLILLCGLALHTQAQKVTLGTLLQEMTERESLARYPVLHFTTKQFSSYDRRAEVKGGEHWYANEDRTNFLRKETTGNGSEWVMFDSDKPGAIVRWWMTFAGEGAGEGMLRVYIDGADRPTIEGRAFDLISGGLLVHPPLSASVSSTTVHNRRGHNLYLPIPYNSCKITYQGAGIKENTAGEITKESVAVYYNINYREYEEGTAVESFGPDYQERYLREINRAQLALLNPYSSIFDRVADKTQQLQKLAPGERMKLSLSGAKYIKALSLKLEAADQSQALRSTVLALSFDGEERLVVPVGDFFGTGYATNPYETYYTKVFYNGRMAAFWPMPFQREATIELINYGEQLVAIHELEAYMDNWEWDDRSMYFGGSWKQFYDKKAGGGKAPEDLDFITLQGQGVYVGDLITLYNDAAAWWGEGDEKIYVDGEEFPSHFGTGTEDYYGYAWSRPEFFEHPFIAQPDGSGNLNVGTAINIRFRALDKIPFSKQLDMDMELWHWRATQIDYAPTTFFYLKPDGEALHEFEPGQVKEKVRFAASAKEESSPEMAGNSIQGENMEAYQIDGGKLVHRNFPDWKWEEDAQVAWWGASVGDVVTMRFRSQEAIEDARLELQLTKSGNYAIVSLSVNGSKEITFDGYASEITVDTLDMEGVDILEGWNTVKVRVVGKNPESGNYVFGLDYLKIKP